MEFQDQAGFNCVRDALWRRQPAATVMVGAGFSKNATPAKLAKELMPSWSELSKAMCGKLYPDKMSEHCKDALASSETTSGALRLAQEFETTFGRAELHGFLKNQIQDKLVQPSSFHARLLRLPWRDVFTTNWDTLLERGSTSINEQSYNIIQSTDEIPLSPTPRIVKLHGSLNGHYPLIYTEENYRTYQQDYAPFVNMVQQSMMESVFCLIGFSGDDPNFLHWSGWVRDNLGEAAPKIYLAGWLNLSNHRRRMLEARNVVPIDLALHPRKNQWPNSLKHKRAMEWILQSLEFGRPYEISNWPSLPRRPSVLVESYLEPIQKATVGQPEEEPQSIIELDQPGDDRTEDVRNLIKAWSYNRKNTYPGWLTAPSRVRATIEGSAREFLIPALDVISQFSALERLLSLRELLWRWEIILNPLSNIESLSARLKKELSNALTSVDCLNRKVEGVDFPDEEWSKTIDAWIEISLALLTSARLHLDQISFERRIDSVLPLRDESEEINHRIIHERCLWSAYSLDYETLKTRLDEWNVETSDPVWMMRKAALLFEIGEDNLAEEINECALFRIRQSNDSDQDIRLVSREAWALYCSGSSSKLEEFWYTSLEWRHRWDKLTPIQCNAPLELKQYQDEIKGQIKPEGGKPFDLGHAWLGKNSFSMDSYNRWVAAHRAVRLVEVVGLPPRRSNMSVASRLLELAARELIVHEPELATRLVLRAATSENSGTLNWTLSRSTVATMPEEVIKRLIDICICATEYIIPRLSVSAWCRYWSGRLAVVLEVLSRLIVRLDSKHSSEILSQALGWYSNIIVSGAVALWYPIGHLLSRLWETLPPTIQGSRIIDLLESPIIGFAGFFDDRITRQYSDPCDVVTGAQNIKATRTPENNQSWERSIAMIDDALQSGGEARQRAARRLSLLFELEILSNEETAQLTKGLWNAGQDIDCDLPDGTGLPEWVFMVLPEPRERIAEKKFREKWLSNATDAMNSQQNPSEVLQQVGSAIENLGERGIDFTISTEEMNFLSNVVEKWVQEPIPMELKVTGEVWTIFTNREVKVVQHVIFGLRNILLRVAISENCAEALYDKWMKFISLQIPVLHLADSLIKTLPDRKNNLVETIRNGFVSDDSNIARNAIFALRIWMHTRRTEIHELVHPPIDLVHEIGVIVSTRRKAALFQALLLSAWIVENGTEDERSAIVPSLVRGLRYLREELEYKRGEENYDDVPELRWACVKVAVSLHNGVLSEMDEIIEKWIAISSCDPLPEVRHLV